jgi:TRAP-type C4-dicarboxylate transport system substrate-binding protein
MTFGIKVISLPLSDVKQYLDSIEILYNAPYPLIVFGWDTGVKYYLTPPLNFSFTAILINQKSSEQIPPQFRDVVESTLKKYIDSVSDMNMKNNEKALEMFEKKGLKKISFPQSEIDKAEKIFRDEVWTPLKDKLYPSWLITQILTKISEFRAKQR